MFEVHMASVTSGMEISVANPANSLFFVLHGIFFVKGTGNSKRGIIIIHSLKLCHISSSDDDFQRSGILEGFFAQPPLFIKFNKKALHSVSAPNL